MTPPAHPIPASQDRAALVRYRLGVQRLIVAAVAALACNSSRPPATAPPTAPIDAGLVSGDPPPLPITDEEAARAGKRTGLGADDERPAVAVEDFARALLAGTEPWARVVDPARGVVELRTTDDASAGVVATMGRRCGGEAEAALARLGERATAALADPSLTYHIYCNNVGLGGTPPVARCSVKLVDERLGNDFELVFTPDPSLGLRLVGIIDLGPTPPEPDVADGFDLELAASDRCP